MFAIDPLHPTDMNVVAGSPRASELDYLMLGGFLVACFTLVCFVERRRFPGVRLALAIGYALLAAFAFRVGAWPAGMVLIVMSGSTVRKWRAASAGRRDSCKSTILLASRRRVALAPHDFEKWSGQMN